jgi:hypothetical protein
MKVLLVLVAGALVLMLLGLGFFLFTTLRVEPERVAASSAPGSSVVAAAAGAESARADDVLARLDTLTREIDDLHAEVLALKAGAERQPAAAPAAVAVENESAAAFAAQHRDAILKVIADERAEQVRKKEEEQRQRDMESLLARADRTAKKFGLDATQQKQLADVYVLEQQKIEDMRTAMRDQGGWQGNPDGVRTAFQEMRDWRLNELTTRLGADLAQKINEADVQAFRGAMGGPGAGGGGRRNRQGGANAGQPQGGDFVPGANGVGGG